MTTLEINNIDIESIAMEAFPDYATRGAYKVNLCAFVRDVLAGLPAPTFSQAERERILAIYEKTRAAA